MRMERLTRWELLYKMGEQGEELKKIRDKIERVSREIDKSRQEIRQSKKQTGENGK